jgi:imidazolonepropionase-like amidohydrolase
VALSLLIAALVCSAPLGAGTGEAIVLRAGILLDGRGGTLRDTRIVLDGARIVEVAAWGAAQPIASPPGERVYDLSRLTILPGLIDLYHT